MSGSFTRFDESPRKEFASRSRVFGTKAKQSVNISRETMTRVARERLGGALQMKLAYNRLGAMESSTARIGSHLSVKA